MKIRREIRWGLMISFGITALCFLGLVIATAWMFTLAAGCISTAVTS